MFTYPLAFLERMKRILSATKDSYDEFLQSLNKTEQKGIYVNTNKIDLQNFIKLADFNLEKILYEKNGFYIDNIKLGHHPLHHAGAFYVQDPSAMFTVNAHKFNGDEKVLDMCASPGGKTIQIANRIPNGILVSNEINFSRAKILYSNVERMGLKNVIVANDTPKNISSAYANCFDVVLLDAPCSGEGMFRRGEEVVNEWNEGLIKLCAERQKEIFKCADICLKTNGTLIYSTCTYAYEENEGLVNFILSNYDYELVEILSPKNFTRGIDMPEVVRLYPHKVRGEGQFVAVLKKRGENNLMPARSQKLKNDKNATEFIKNNLNIQLNIKNYKNFSYYVLDEDMIKQGVNYLSVGVKVGEMRGNSFVPDHFLFSAFGKFFNQKLNLKVSDERVEKYVKGEEISTSLREGYGALLIENCPLGGFKITKNGFKNRYPKGLRRLK